MAALIILSREKKMVAYKVEIEIVYMCVSLVTKPRGNYHIKSNGELIGR
jgi:hypothetical protein